MNDIEFGWFCIGASCTVLFDAACNLFRRRYGSYIREKRKRQALKAIIRLTDNMVFDRMCHCDDADKYLQSHNITGRKHLRLVTTKTVH